MGKGIVIQSTEVQSGRLTYWALMPQLEYHVAGRLQCRKEFYIHRGGQGALENRKGSDELPVF